MLDSNGTGGIKVGAMKVWSLAYADDEVLLAKDAIELKVMTMNLEEYLEEKQLTLNSKKSKVMECSKGTGRRKKMKSKWKGIQLESVTKFLYLGVLFRRNANIAWHLKERVKKVNVALNQVWGLGERTFRNSLKMRLFSFNTLVIGVLMHGVELWEYREKEEVKCPNKVPKMDTKVKCANTGLHCFGGI